MAVEFRSAREAELEDYLRVVKYVFAVPPRDAARPEAESWRLSPERTVCAFVDDQLVSTYGAYDFTVRLNGAPVSMAGVTNVGTLPGYRRRGFVRELVTRGLSDARDRGQSCAILWASYGAIYQRFGYGLASLWTSYRWDPRYGALSGPAASGQADVVTFEEGRPIAERVLAQYVAPRNLMIERGKAGWDRIFEPDEPSWKPHQMVIYRDAVGEPCGYLTFRNREQENDDPGPNQYVKVGAFVALDTDAYRGLWNFLAGHDLVREIEMEGVPEDDPAPLLLLEPRSLRRRTGDGIWMRVADVERALGQQPRSTPHMGAPLRHPTPRSFGHRPPALRGRRPRGHPPHGGARGRRRTCGPGRRGHLLRAGKRDRDRISGASGARGRSARLRHC